MRNTTFISSMVGIAAAVAVAGSANAAIVSHLNLNQVWNGGSSGTGGGRILNIMSASDGGGSKVADFRFSYAAAENKFTGMSASSWPLGAAQATTTDLQTTARIFSFGEYSSPMSLSYGGIEGGGPTIFVKGSSVGSSLSALNGTTGYLGFAIFDMDENTLVISNVRYGWIQFTGNATGTPGGTIVGYAYDTTGATIAAGYIPAPGAVALLGVAGMIGSRRRRA